MPDPELLPAGRSLEAAPVSAGGLGAVLAEARRRRRVHVGIASGIGSLALVVAVLLAGGVPGKDALSTTSPAHSGAPAPTTHATVAHSSSSPAPSAPTSRPSATVPATVAGRPVPQTKPPSPRVSAHVAGNEVGPPHSITAYDQTRTCNGDGPTPAQGWCSYYDGSTSGAAGSPVELAASVCRISGQGVGSLSVDSGQQAEFHVEDSRRSSEWTWSSGHRFSAQGTQITVAAGTCVRWSVGWNVTDQQGRPLAPGTYQLTARPYVVVSGGNSVASYTNPLTFTVS